MDVNEIIKPENLVYDKPRLMNDNPMHYCPGCSHGVVHKLVAEVIDEMGMARSGTRTCTGNSDRRKTSESVKNGIYISR